MLATEMIAHLQVLVAEHGDLPCYHFFEIDRKGNGSWGPYNKNWIVYRSECDDIHSDEPIMQEGFYF